MSSADIARQVGIFMGACLVLYVAAVGPISVWLDRNPAQRSVYLPHLAVLYYPLGKACEYCRPIEWGLSAYCDLWKSMLPERSN
jgi:hypothetical protein